MGIGWEARLAGVSWHASGGGVSGCRFGSTPEVQGGYMITVLGDGLGRKLWTIALPYSYSLNTVYEGAGMCDRKGNGSMH